MEIFRDKFFILCVVSCLILFSFCIFYQEDENSKEIITGVVVKNIESEKGFVFDIETSSGTMVHCFCKECPLLNEVYSINGSYSDDKTIFFVTELYHYGSD